MTTKMPLIDQDEDLNCFEPLIVSETSKHKSLLTDLALELVTLNASLRSSLPAAIAKPLSELVRAMNCYYSNLIEGHNTHPVEIEQALNQVYLDEPRKRNLQIEAKSHIAVQEWIDQNGLQDLPTSPKALQEIHQRFCELLPDELLLVTNQKTSEITKVIPGEFRKTFVSVGNHVAVSPGAVPRFMTRMHQVFSNLSKVDTILSAAYAHHRFLWIHPFVDGNGRVARLMSYAILRNALDTRGLWSIARGLAREEQKYKQLLAACDIPRRNDLDGRGSLSEEELARFTEFFLTVCIDQINFMGSLMQIDKLRDRIVMWAEEQIRNGKLQPKSDIILKAILFQGGLERAEIAQLLGVSDRTASRITSALIKIGACQSANNRAPIEISFPAALSSRWMPGLFPEYIKSA